MSVSSNDAVMRCLDAYNLAEKDESIYLSSWFDRRHRETREKAMDFNQLAWSVMKIRGGEGNGRGRRVYNGVGG